MSLINWSIKTAYHAPASPHPKKFTNTYPTLNRMTHDPIKIAMSGHTVSPAPRSAPEVIN